MTDQPIKKLMSKPEAAGRMVQWAIELSQFDIKYHPRTAIKAQALADFIAEFTALDEDSLTNEAKKWTIQTDGSSAQKRGGVGVVIITPDGEMLKYEVQLKFSATNNEAEYEGILTRLRLGKALEAKNLLVQSDSKLVIGQIKGGYEAKEERMQKYLKQTKFQRWHQRKQLDGAHHILPLERAPPQNTDKARKIKKREASFTILNDILFKRGFSMPYLKCVNEEEAKYILEEIHKGICEDHAGPRSLVDATEFIKKCDKCQRFGNVQRLPAEKLTTITSPWPFAQWEIDIIGPMPIGKGQVKFLLVAIDYFTKWVEAEPLATIIEARIQSFLWKNIICKFRIPRTIISDNRRQFDSQGFRSFCSGLGIKNQFS
nr:uncharacterized protein LOC111988025 [Quercus suber]